MRYNRVCVLRDTLRGTPPVEATCNGTPLTSRTPLIRSPLTDGQFQSVYGHGSWGDRKQQINQPETTMLAVLFQNGQTVIYRTFVDHDF